MSDDAGPRLSSRAVPGAMVAGLTGDIDLASAHRLETELKELVAGVDAVLDLTGVTYLDSSGVRLIEHVGRAVSTGGRRLRLVVPREAVCHRLIVLTLPGLPLHQDVTRALESLAVPPDGSGA